ncbi:MAG: DNA-binding protein WhiA [Clostridia bacterium]|nr:DNA-binding protein WhiA [Clostridia bacterium]
MSINNTIKEEIFESKITSVCCKKAFLAGVILGAGSLPIEHGGLGLMIQHTSKELIQKCAAILLQLTDTEPEIIKKEKEMSLGQRTVYEIHLPPETASPLLAELGILDPPYGIHETASQDIVAASCCKKSFLQGVFCAAGSLTISNDCETTNTKGYNLDIVLCSQKSAHFTAELMNSLGIAPGLRAKKNNYSVYLKDSEKIGDFCITIGANSALFKLNNIVASRSLRNDANRRTNCEVANIDKTLSASAKHIEAIAFIEKKAGLNYLDDALRDTAKARRAHPEATLNELTKLLRYPTSKSGLNHRLRKLIQIANELGGNHD